MNIYKYLLEPINFSTAVLVISIFIIVLDLVIYYLSNKTKTYLKLQYTHLKKYLLSAFCWLVGAFIVSYLAVSSGVIEINLDNNIDANYIKKVISLVLSWPLIANGFFSMGK